MYKPSEYARVLKSALVLVQTALNPTKSASGEDSKPGFGEARLAKDLRALQENHVRPNTPLIEGMWFEFDVASEAERIA